MKEILFFGCAIFFIATNVQAQTVNPCTASVTSPSYSPTAIVMTLTDFDATIPAADGTATTNPLATEYQIGIFNTGTSPNAGSNPVSSVTIPRSAITLVAGTTDCYRADLASQLISLPVNVVQFAAVKARRTFPDTAESEWSAVSNPFLRPTVLHAPSSVRLIP